MAMMATSNHPVSRYGLTQVYSPQGGGHVDVVFVHGLNGDPQKTWTAEKSRIFWPEQLLPPILEEEKARILVYGYDADVATFTDGASRDKIHNHAEHLIAELAANRRIRKATERPIIFVAHSLGGLVVKRALIYSSEIRGNYTEHLRSIFVSTYGILFLGTPHKGSDLAKWGSRLEAICSAVMPTKAIDSNDNLVQALKSNNEILQNIDRQFIQLISRFHVYFFHEGKPTDLKTKREFIVDEESASPTIQDVERAVIQQDHSHMCKFEDDGAPGFDLVAEGIQRYAGEAPATVASRWESEKAERIAKKKAEVEEILPGSVKRSPNTDSAGTTPDTSQILDPKSSPMMTDDATNTTAPPNNPLEPYFIVPPGFRPNTFFVGLDKEYTELDKRLFGKRRHDGTACVLLYGQPGSGKSHLARQYVNKNRKSFPGGIFWICAESSDTRRHAFWNIKQKLVSKDCPELCDGVNCKDYVQLVKAWFEGRHDWLIVFEGVTVEHDDEAADLANYVPDSKDSSIIYISRAKNLESNRGLLSPSALKVGPLKQDDAKKLLFKELHIKKPTEPENRKATELVKKVGGLPLAINAISRRLADTHEPLTKYRLSTFADPTIDGTYNTILDDLQRLGYMEAWNLINILCWFAPDLPFEMVNLGLKILKAKGVDVRAKEGTGKPDIDNTVAILMRYALLERNEPDEKESASSSRDSLNEPEPIDMLRIHNVVQNFCCESLNAKGFLPQYLGYAVNLFSYSYYQADVRIKQKPEPGRVSDYRYYETHGKWLLSHTKQYETKTQSLETIKSLLSPVLSKISDEIQAREPSSSQESLRNGIFQISIFDRTSSSSDSGPTGPPTPANRPIPPPLADETDFGFPVGKAIDSPASFGTVSPGLRPKILGNSPRLPSYDDVGYESDRSGGHRETPMPRDLSGSTARPPTPPRRSRAPTSESHGGEWQVVRNSRKQPRRRRDLGSFRPTPSKAQVNRQIATGSIPRASARKDNRRDSSPAFKALENVQSRSPPLSRAGLTTLVQRGPLSPPASVVPSQPTWAGVAAGKVGQPAQQIFNAPVSETTRPPRPTLHDRSRSTSRTRPGGSGGVGPSPLVSEFVPHGTRRQNYEPQSTSFGQPDADTSTRFQYTTPYPGSSSDITQIPQARPNITSSQSYYTPRSYGPNPAPLPYDDNVSLTSKRPLPQDFQRDHQQSAHSSPQSQQPSPQNQTSPYQPINIPYPPSTLPSGYYSQPMSRNQSHLSHGSIAETDPTRYPSTYSPQLMPTFPSGSSPRDRHSDGRPYSKSPKTDFTIPAYAPQSRPYSPRDSIISHTGGWAPAYPPSPQQQYDGTMSRSSSGPGIAISGDHTSSSIVQFGDHQPLSIEGARRRTAEHEQRLLREQKREVEVLAEVGEEKEREKRGEEWERGRLESKRDAAPPQMPPYPNINLIRTASDAVAVKGMVGQNEEGRGRGREMPTATAPAPGSERSLGLGLSLGS